MHNTTVRLLKKQKQLIAMELASYKELKQAGKRGIHSEQYYIKLALAWESIKKAIKVLENIEDDIYSEFNCLDQ